MLTINKKLNLKAFDLFSGVGGFRAGAQSPKIKKLADIDFVGFSEIDKYALKTYRANFDTANEFFIDDIEKITKIEESELLAENTKENVTRMLKINNELPDFDILFGGFPCQSHSLMGNRKGVEDERGNLFYSIREILRAKRPKFFVLENVRAIRSVNNGEFFSYIQHCLKEELGYELTILDINSADYGVPQTRRRTFFIGVLNTGLNVIIKEPSKISWEQRKFQTTWHLLQKEVDPKYFLSEKIKKTILADEKKGYKRKAEINKLIARPLTRTMHKMHRASQDNYYSLDFINGEYNEVEQAVSLSSNGAENIRRITPLEAFRLQGFEDEFVYRAIEQGVSDTRLYMQAGNAVTVNAVEAVLDALFTGYLKIEATKETKEEHENCNSPIQLKSSLIG